MAILNARELRDRGAAAADRCRSEGRRLVLVYCGVIAALALGSNGVHLLLDSRIGDTGGLDGMGLRSVLQTVQEILTYVNTLFGPFWAAGFVYAMVSMVRGNAPRPADLTQGFRRVGRILSASLYQFLLIFSLTMATIMGSSLLFSLTSWGSSVDLMSAETSLTELLPFLLIWLVLFLGAYGHVYYSFSMGVYLMMERRIGGVAALMESRRLTRGHKWQLLKLDLSFWWYHALGLLISVVGYLDAILTVLQVPLPMDPTVMFFVTMAAYCVLQTALFLWKKCEVDAAHVLAYEAIAHPEPETAVTVSE